MFPFRTFVILAMLKIWAKKKKRGIYNQISDTAIPTILGQHQSQALRHFDALCGRLRVLWLHHAEDAVCPCVSVHISSQSLSEKPLAVASQQWKDLKVGRPLVVTASHYPQTLVDAAFCSQLHPKEAIIKHASVCDYPRIVWIPKVTFADSDPRRQWILWSKAFTHIQPAEMYSLTIF